MKVVELRFPGSFPQIPGIKHKTLQECFADEDARRLNSLLDLLKHQLGDATVCLEAYQNEKSRGFADQSRWESGEVRRKWENRRIRHKTVEDQYGRVDPTKYSEVYQAIARKLDREDWQAGETPRALTGRLIFVNARGFIHSLHIIGRSLKQLGAMIPMNAKMGPIIDEFQAQFPQLTDVRDSSSHIDERWVGEARGKKIDLDPLKTGFEILVLDSLVNDQYITTFADGSSGGCRIDGRSLDIACSLIQRAIDAADWIGPPSDWP